jgi:ubiquinone/menaquinone biosynthesis C-methylase UbiE
MKKILFTLLSLLAALIGAAIWWRWASRRRQLPCPTWLAGLLDNPLTEAVAGTQTTLDRIGLQPGEVVLDVGSGPGRLAVPAAQRVGPDGRVVALDVQPEMLARLQERAVEAGVTNITSQLADIAGDISLPANSFDRAWLVTVLGEIPDREAALYNLWRLLKPGGTLSITEIFPDPHYQARSTVLQLGQAAGFEPNRYWGTPLAFTQNFVKSGSK